MNLEREIRRLLESRDYSSLKILLQPLEASKLRDAWRSLPPLEKAAVFKLLEPDRAMEFYGSLDFEEQYFVLCALEPGVIAPMTESLAPGARSLFRKLPREYMDRIVQQAFASAEGTE